MTPESSGVLQAFGMRLSGWLVGGIGLQLREHALVHSRPDIIALIAVGDDRYLVVDLLQFAVSSP